MGQPFGPTHRHRAGNALLPARTTTVSFQTLPQQCKISNGFDVQRGNVGYTPPFLTQKLVLSRKKRKAHAFARLARLGRNWQSHEIDPPSHDPWILLALWPRISAAGFRGSFRGSRGGHIVMGIFPGQPRPLLQTLRRFLRIRNGRLDESESHPPGILDLGHIHEAS